MHCAEFGRNWPDGSGDSRRCKRDQRRWWRLKKNYHGKLTWAFVFGKVIMSSVKT